jgi:hypothetical protein
VGAAGAAQTNRELVADESATAVGEDRRTAGEACTLLLAFPGGRSSEPAAVRGNAGSDRAAGGADRLTTAGQAHIGIGLQRVVGIRRGVTKVGQKGAILRCVDVDRRPLRAFQMKVIFTTLRTGEMGVTTGTVFEVKKEIPDKSS